MSKEIFESYDEESLEHNDQWIFYAEADCPYCLIGSIQFVYNCKEDNGLCDRCGRSIKL